MARITHVTYQRVRNLGKFETCRVEATAEVDVLEDPEEVLEALMVWVADKVNGSPARPKTFKPYKASDASDPTPCCANEKRNMNGGCTNCGDPAT